MLSNKVRICNRLVSKCFLGLFILLWTGQERKVGESERERKLIISRGLTALVFIYFNKVDIEYLYSTLIQSRDSPDEGGQPHYDGSLVLLHLIIDLRFFIYLIINYYYFFFYQCFN